MVSWKKFSTVFIIPEKFPTTMYHSPASVALTTSSYWPRVVSDEFTGPFIFTSPLTGSTKNTSLSVLDDWML